MKPDKPLPILRLVIDLLLLGVLLTVFVLVTPSVRAAVETWLGVEKAPNNKIYPIPLLITAPPLNNLTVLEATRTLTDMGYPAETPTPFLPVVNPTIAIQDNSAITRISQGAGWTPLLPAWLPEGYSPANVIFDQKNNIIYLTYDVTRSLPDGNGLTETKTINLVQAQTNTVVPFQVGPSNNRQDIQVGNAPAVYATGGWDSTFVPNKDEVDGGHFESTWNNDTPVQNIYWQSGPTFLVLISADPQISKDDLIKMAASVYQPAP